MVKITCDSTADLEALFRKRNIDVLPLIVTLGEKSYHDGVDVTPPDIFTFVKENNVLPKTAARNEDDFYTFFKQYVDYGDSVIHFNISSKFSASNEMAKKAASRLNNVFVIDSYNLSTGTGLLAMHACDMAEAGASAEEIVKSVNARIPYVQASFVVDTMEYLRKGGRCSGIASFAASVLKIKPTILVKDGGMVVGKKYMGNFDKVILKYVADTLNSFNNPDYTRIFVTHTYASDETVSSVIQEIKKLAPFKEIIETKAGCTVTSHCGKNTLGILYINDGFINPYSVK